MSLLNRSTDVVTVFAEIVVTDDDGNKITKPGTVGVVARAVVQPLSSKEGDEGTESRYRLRLINYPSVLGAQSQIEWRGKRYSIVGEGMVYSGSRRTAHVDYTMVRK